MKKWTKGSGITAARYSRMRTYKGVSLSLQFLFLRVSSPKNENVINYSPSCCSKPVRLLQNTNEEIFDEIRDHVQQRNYHFQGTER